MKLNQVIIIFKILLTLFNESWISIQYIRRNLQVAVQNERLIGRREQDKDIIPGKNAGWLL